MTILVDTKDKSKKLVPTKAALKNIEKGFDNAKKREALRKGKNSSADFVEVK